MGKDSTNSPVEVSIVGADFQDSDMLVLCRLHALESLELVDTGITDSGLCNSRAYDSFEGWMCVVPRILPTRV